MVPGPYCETNQCNLGHQAITLTKDDHDKGQHAII